MGNRKYRYLYENVPVPRSTAYRRRREALIAARNQQDETDSEPEVEPRPHQDIFEDGCNSEGPISDTISTHSSSPVNSDEWSDHYSRHEDDVQPDIARSAADVQDVHLPSSSEDSLPSRSPSPWSGESIDSAEERNISPEMPNHQEGNEGQPKNLLLDDQLCPCTTTTEGDAMLMCLAIGMRHNLSWQAIVDMLKMINVLFNNEVMHASKHFLQKFFDAGEESAVIHVYCSKCEQYLGTKASVTDEQMMEMECQNCGERVKNFSSSSAYFVSMDLKGQFQKFMESPGIATDIMTYRYSRPKSQPDSFDDIFDGEYYKQFSSEEGILSMNKNFSVAINTDGVSLGMSTPQSAWPIFLSVNELNPRLRKKHLIFAGIWVSKKSPNMGVFLKPFIDNMKDLITNGFEWKDQSGEIQLSRVLPLLSLLDSGARYKYLNLSSYASYYGCTYCYHKAEYTTKGVRFCLLAEPAPVRTHDSMRTDMMIAYQNRNNGNAKHRVYKGCKGLTPLVYLEPYHNLGKSVIVDYMHNALLGVTRAHMFKVLQVTSGKKNYIGNPEKMHLINERLLLIRPPTSITRLPRDLKDIKFFRANEWRTFLLFYGIVCMDGIMSKRDLEHFSLLSCAFYTLLQRSILPKDLNIAPKYLLTYVACTQIYHGKAAMTYNIHLLNHVATNVRDFGPLYAQNMFVFEGENRHLGQMMTSPGRVALQLTRRYLTVSSFPRFCEIYASSEKPIEFIEDITGRKLQKYLRCGETVLMGLGRDFFLPDEVYACLMQGGIHPSSRNVLSFEKVLHDSIRYTTSTYSEGKRNDDSWVKVKTGTRGRIERILHISCDSKKIVVFIINQVQTSRRPLIKTSKVTVSHIKKVEGEGALIAVNPRDVVAQCIFMALDIGNFIVDIPYGCYGD